MLRCALVFTRRETRSDGRPCVQSWRKQASVLPAEGVRASCLSIEIAFNRMSKREMA
jgi:hypothetical protein